MTGHIHIANEQEIKDRCNIVEVIAHLTDIKRKGKDYHGLCPFHNEKTPSFSVSPAKGMYKCFGCGASGSDSIAFVMAHEKLTYPDALKWLAAFYKIDIEGAQSVPQIKQRDSTHIQFTPRPVNLPWVVLEKTMSNDNSNNVFINWLRTLFEPCVVNGLVQKFCIGTTKGDITEKGANKWGCGDGEAVTFPFINERNELRAIQVKLFKPDGHTAKYQNYAGERKACINWIPRMYRKSFISMGLAEPEWITEYESQNAKKLNTFFGAQQLALSENAHKPIAIVESPKAVIVCSVLMPSNVWLATSSLTNLTPELLNILQGKRVIFYPDLGRILTEPEVQEMAAKLRDKIDLSIWEYDKGKDWNEWKQIAQALKGRASFTISDILETTATGQQRADKWDMADFATSESIRRELIEAYKSEMLNHVSHAATPEAYKDELTGIWLKYQARGLRVCDKLQAHKEMSDTVPDEQQTAA